MLTILYEDKEIIVAVKPSGVESQSSRGFSQDMVSMLSRHLYTKLSTDWGKVSTNQCGMGKKDAVPYIGVIHRLDKPVSGVMVYAKTRKAAAVLSNQVKEGWMNKVYAAVICGKPVDNVGNFVDYLRKEGKSNCSVIVDKSAEGAKRAELEYQVLGSCMVEDVEGREEILSLVEVHLLTGRHHQIRVQFASRGMPLWGDNRYHPDFAQGRRRGSIALCGTKLSFMHPSRRETMTFSTCPQDGAFAWFKPILSQN